MRLSFKLLSLVAALFIGASARAAEASPIGLGEFHRVNGDSHAALFQSEEFSSDVAGGILDDAAGNLGSAAQSTYLQTVDRKDLRQGLTTLRQHSHKDPRFHPDHPGSQRPIHSVPEPGTLLLIGSGIAVLLARTLSQARRS